VAVDAALWFLVSGFWLVARGFWLQASDLRLLGVAEVVASYCGVRLVFCGLGLWLVAVACGLLFLAPPPPPSFSLRPKLT
jgi:hypothetical protein